MRITVSSGRVPAGISVTTAFRPKYASPQPTAQAATASTKLSTRRWRIRPPRVAPSVTRMAISRSRAVARASKRLATLLHASSRGLRRRSQRRARTAEIERGLGRLRDRGTELVLQFSGGEPLYDDLVGDGLLARLDRWPNVSLDRIPGSDHTFRALQLQRHVHRVLDESLERVLKASSSNVAESQDSAPGRGQTLAGESGSS